MKRTWIRWLAPLVLAGTLFAPTASALPPPPGAGDDDDKPGPTPGLQYMFAIFSIIAVMSVVVMPTRRR